MLKELSKLKIIALGFIALLVPLPTYAIDATGSGNFWIIVIGIFIVSIFLVLSFLPWLTYRAIKNGNIFWIVVTLILCSTGIFFSFILYWEILTEDKSDGIGFLIFLLSSSVYFILFFKTLYKIQERRYLLDGDGTSGLDIYDEEKLHNKFRDPREDFILYQKLSTDNEVTQLFELLKNNNIEYQFEDHSPTPDIIFSTSEHEKEFWIKIKKKDFETVDKIRSDYTASLLDNIAPEYHLFTFSNQELQDVINTPDEWSSLDVLLAQKILKERLG